MENELAFPENKILTFRDYQEKTQTTAIYKSATRRLLDLLDIRRDSTGIENLLNLAYVGLGLGEVGEIQGKIKKIIRDSGGVITFEHKKAIGKELGDLLWYVSQTCNELEISLEEVAGGNLEKLAGRKERGVLGGSGDDR